MSSCYICLLKNDEDCTNTICDHKFHKRCLHQWLKRNNTCPVCRKDKPDSNFAIAPDKHCLSGTDLENFLILYKNRSFNLDDIKIFIYNNT
jgi:hypothetical protein